MKGKNEKQKVVSFLLAFTMIFSIFVPSIDVLAQENENLNIVEEKILDEVVENVEDEVKNQEVLQQEPNESLKDFLTRMKK